MIDFLKILQLWILMCQKYFLYCLFCSLSARKYSRIKIYFKTLVCLLGMMQKLSMWSQLPASLRSLRWVSGCMETLSVSGLLLWIEGEQDSMWGTGSVRMCSSCLLMLCLCLGHFDLCFRGVKQIKEFFKCFVLNDSLSV